MPINSENVWELNRKQITTYYYWFYGGGNFAVLKENYKNNT